MDRKAVAPQIHRTVRDISIDGAIDPMLESLNERRGVLLTSSYEYPGRYTRWDIGFINPPVCLESSGRRFCFQALNERGRLLLPILANAMSRLSAVVEFKLLNDSCEGVIAPANERFAEEERSKSQEARWICISGGAAGCDVEDGIAQSVPRHHPRLIHSCRV